jgi:hypothetical protein
VDGEQLTAISGQLTADSKQLIVVRQTGQQAGCGSHNFPQN